jgi:3-hydroxyisobutyrate dehydrogenase-like beta-hydroxyacid dehydrogenase
MGQKTFMICEDAPAANLIKLSGNLLITTVIESLAEGFALMRKAGVDPLKFLEVLTESMFSAPVYKTYGGIIASEKFEPVGFKLPLGFKDTGCSWRRLKRLPSPCRWPALCMIDS